MDGVTKLRPRDRLPLTHHLVEVLVLAHFPFHLDRDARHTAPVQRLWGKSRPEHHTIGQRVAAGQGERRGEVESERHREGLVGLLLERDGIPRDS